MLTFALLALASLQSPAPAADAFVEVDFAQVDRRITKEPKYVAQPRYGLFVLDPAGKFTCWAVFDKSSPGAAHYDVLYFDRNGNRDLTEPGERITSDWSEERAAIGLGIELKVGDVKVPGTDLVHTNLRFATARDTNRPGFWFHLKWNGKEPVSGGHAPVAASTTIYSPTAKDAPILRPAPLGELVFALYTYGWDRTFFYPGTQAKLAVLVGKAGSKPDAISVMGETFLDLDKDVLTATLVVKRKSGQVERVVSRIRKHC